MAIKDYIGEGLISITFGAAIFGALCLVNFPKMRPRKTLDEYTFQYLGKPAVVKREDIRLSPDRYYLVLNNRDKITDGQIITDDGKSINIHKGSKFYVEDNYEPKQD